MRTVLRRAALAAALLALLTPFFLGSSTLKVQPAQAQGSSGPQKAPGYEDFTAYYQRTTGKDLPFYASALIDAGSGSALYYHQEATPVPTASLVKMVTAGTVLAAPHDWYAPVSFTAAENNDLLRQYVGPRDSFSLLKLEPGEQVTFEQAFASMLIGSPNNPPAAMPRLTDMPRGDFVAAMRRTAERWGMRHTSIEEPSGLSLANISTALDLSRAACNLFSDFMASFYGSSPSVSFITSTGRKKTVFHTVYDLRTHPATYFGAKTGYLTETKFHVAAGIITPQGHRLCVAVLISQTRAESEGALRALAAWADRAYRW